MASTNDTYAALKKRSKQGPVTHKKKRSPKKKAGALGFAPGGVVPDVMPLPDGGADVALPATDAMLEPMMQGGAQVIPLFDGGAIVDFAPRRGPEKLEHDANIAEHLENGELTRIGEMLLEGIEADDASRQEWLNMRAKGIDLLGFKIEQPRTGTASAPVDGMAVVRHPLLAEAVERGRANARGELLPASGPVKVRNDGEETEVNDDLARCLERDMNHYLTCTATEYYDDTDRMLFWTFFGGSGFKKVYWCPIRRRPVSESVDAKDMIISNDATDIANASRVTQCITMRKSTMRRMQLLGAYRDIELDMPMTPAQTIVDIKIANQQGLQAPYRPEDRDYDLYECYCELDIAGFEHRIEKGRRKGKPSGLPLPYRVVIERSSRQILEIRRNWEENDTDYMAKQVFVHFMFETGLGLYGLGLLNILGNTTNALTQAWRLVLDAGQFANFPGFLYAKSSGMRNSTNQFRVAPGSGAAIETGGQAIQNVVMPLPYKSADAGFIGFLDNVAQTGYRLGGASESMVAEGKQEAPVGTTLALIEQATKAMSAVHKRLHSAQAQEFRLLRNQFRKDPSSLWRGNKKAQRYWNEDKLRAALEDYSLVPCADPNVPSQMHRMMKANAVQTLARTAPPGTYDMKKIDTWVLNQIGVAHPESFFAPPQPPPPPDPIAMAAMQLKEKDQMLKTMKVATEAQIKREQMISDENVEALRIAERLASNPESNQIVDDQLREMRDWMHPTALNSQPPIMPPMGGMGMPPPQPGTGGMPMGPPG